MACCWSSAWLPDPQLSMKLLKVCVCVGVCGGVFVGVCVCVCAGVCCVCGRELCVRVRVSE